MPKPPVSRSANRILSALNRQDAALITPLLERIELPRRKYLEHRGRRLDYSYFVDTGVGSVVADGASVRSVEVGMIGREGFTGHCAIMGVERSALDTFMQVAGWGQRIEADALKQLANESATLRAALLRFAYGFSLQIAQTALSNARGKLEERLSRWLLMVHDRVAGDEVRLTHEFLSTMLGVRRAGVSVAMKHLEKGGLIRVHRGAIQIIDREGLELSSNGAYGAIEKAHTQY